MGDGLTPAALLDAIGAEIDALAAALDCRDRALLAERPPSGKWSVVENVRHVLFAEELHLGRFNPEGRSFSSVGLPPHNMGTSRSLPEVGSAPSNDAAEVLAAWRETHAKTRSFLAGEEGEAARLALERNLRHLRAHVRVIGRLLRELDRPPAQKRPR